MLKYIVKARKNPMNSDVKYYAQLTSPDVVDFERISEMIAQNCTLTRHDILACLSAFQEQLINCLQDGKSVRLGDLGSFRVGLHSVGAPTEKAFTAALISRISFHFVPASRLRKMVSVGAPGIKFSLFVPPVEPPGALPASASAEVPAGNDATPAYEGNENVSTGA